MKVGSTHLTYCTNIHPGESWPEVFENLQRELLGVRQLVCPDQPFGIGLRLSACAAETLSQPDELSTFQAFLEQHQLYVFTINGFPYGQFHGRAVKEAVYQPDWTTPERAGYTQQLIEILSQLLPSGLNGSISTVPAGFQPDFHGSSDTLRVVQALYAQVSHLHQVRQSRGQTLALALEPEPCCLLETSQDVVDFFERELLPAQRLQVLAQTLSTSLADAERILRQHLGVCLDTCHAAVEFETPTDSVQTLTAAGIRIVKLQASAGLRLPQVDSGALAALSEYDEPVYLHQVVARTAAGQLLRFLDLPAAFASAEARAASEWRVHFHVPLYQEQLQAFSNTQGYLSEILELHQASPLTDHVEVETYTWQVLPEAQRSIGLQPSIARELRWVRDRLPS